MCAQVLQGGECIPPACPLSGAARTPRRNGGHLNPPLYHDYVRLKSDFGVESAKRIIRFRRAHLSALREAVEEIGALDHSQIRDVEKLDVYFDHDTFKEGVQALEVWRKDMPEEAADSRVIEGSEAAKVTICFSSPGPLYRSDGHRSKMQTDVPTL
jgi:transposase InsO family protein